MPSSSSSQAESVSGAPAETNPTASISSTSAAEPIVDSERPKTPPRDEESRELPLSEYEKAWRLISSAPASTRRRLMGPSTSTPQDSSTSPQASNSLENLTLSTNGKFEDL